MSQITSDVRSCTNPFTLGYQESCTLILEINGGLLKKNIVGGPFICQSSGNNLPNPNACYQPKPSDQLNISQTSTLETAIISTNPSTLALSVKCPPAEVNCDYTNSALTGKPRTIEVSNLSTNISAFNVSYSAPSLPDGTSISPSTCDILPGQLCTFTVTPGPTANPTPATISFTGTNTNTVSKTVRVLTYGASINQDMFFQLMITPHRQ